jgi:hypothetical protein
MSVLTMTEHATNRPRRTESGDHAAPFVGSLVRRKLVLIVDAPIVLEVTKQRPEQLGLVAHESVRRELDRLTGARAAV